ncbi:hypothetical protein GY45DRAFT_959318 [Cubamyces sp. BRFM 1775]|nr:hypothetical protein GY45DRAFT_959318 [Cubamyces sp. BRFM 1775]
MHLTECTRQISHNLPQHTISRTRRACQAPLALPQLTICEFHHSSPVMNPSQNAQQETQERVRRASEPFDREDADFIIRSSDKVEFYVHRIILALASPVFAAMLMLPQPLGADVHRPAVDVVEDSETLDAFLRVCYPLPDPELTVLDLIRKVLAAAAKYEAAAVSASMRMALLRPAILEPNPLRVFAIACCFGLEAEARTAAERAVINNRVSGRICAELGEITAGAYHRLLRLNSTRKTTKSKRSGINSVTVDFTGIGPFCEPPKHTARAARASLQTVAAPFDAKDADLVLRSRDSIDFRVYRSILALASPTILQKAPLLSVAESGDDEAATNRAPPIHLMPEDSVVLDALLRMCYPVDHPQLSDLDVLLDVLSAARSYGMKKAEQAIRASWPAHIDKAPLRLYLAAACCGWAEEAQACATALVQQYDIPSIHSQYLPEMEMMANEPYRRLLAFLEKRSKAATSPCTLSPGDVCPEPSYFCGTTRDSRFPHSFSTAAPPSWSSSCFASFTTALQNRPLGSTLALATEHVKSFMRRAAGLQYVDSDMALVECGAADDVSWACAVVECYAREVEIAVEKVQLEVDGLAA